MPARDKPVLDPEPLSERRARSNRQEAIRYRRHAWPSAANSHSDIAKSGLSHPRPLARIEAPPSAPTQRVIFHRTGANIATDQPPPDPWQSPAAGFGATTDLVQRLEDIQS